ncbi:MAG: DUF2061 domain-containing protein [Phycisphaerae bacterium]|jgi:uncharacterized membrane protein
METHSRTIVKALTYRMMGLLLTVLTAWAITRRADVAASIGIADTVIKIFAFYFHERLWLKIEFGKLGLAAAPAAEESRHEQP